MALFSTNELGRLERAGALILEAEDKLPVLRSLNWDRSLADDFFERREKVLPHPVYPRIDTAPCLERLKLARTLVQGSTPVHAWLTRLADVVEQTAAMLSTVGTRAFYGHSASLYGSPATPIADGRTNALDLARRLHETLSEYDEGSLRLEPPESLTAQALKARLDAELPLYFGDAAPRVDVTKNVSAKAAAGRDYIKLRADGKFSDLDAVQLLQHEALIHIATGKNGAAQTRFPILAESHPGNARTQEGLAVFAEFISGGLDPRRFKRLADRVVAIDMAASGADFVELYRFFREQAPSDPPFEAFESARRVVRGGLVEGGAPFTKDSVYLGGLLEVHNYFRAAVRSGDAGFIRLLFVGKIDLADLEAMKLLHEAGYIGDAKFLPPWAKDLRYLLSYLAYSSFLNGISLKDVAARYDMLLGTAPRRAQPEAAATYTEAAAAAPEPIPDASGEAHQPSRLARVFGFLGRGPGGR